MGMTNPDRDQQQSGRWITGADKTKSIQAGIFGHPAVGDFNKDGKPTLRMCFRKQIWRARHSG